MIDQEKRHAEMAGGIVHNAISIACEVTAICMPTLEKIDFLSTDKRMQMLLGAGLYCLRMNEITSTVERENLSLEKRRTIIFLRCAKHFENEYSIKIIWQI